MSRSASLSAPAAASDRLRLGRFHRVLMMALATAAVAVASAARASDTADTAPPPTVQTPGETKSVSLPTEPESPRYSALRYDSEYPPIGYSDTPKHNAFARLQERMNRGEVKLEWKAPRGYLDSLLKALKLDPSSQTLVFSKTSLEISFINEKTPRAIYFDDETYVAFVQGAPALELMAVDSVIGPVFYTLPNRDPKIAARLDRETLRCLNCHDSFSLMGGGVPHFLMVSTYAGVEGERSQRNASIDTNDATPMKSRWGGWYVTGQSGNQQHLGNVVVRTQQDLDNVDALRKGNLNSLQGLFDTKPYLTDKSDIVALLVLQHQVTLHNLITRANYKSRAFVARDRTLASNPNLSVDQAPPRAQKAFKAMYEPLVKGLLNSGAVQFTAPISGNAGFEAWFQKQGPRDPKGRSLRELDLKTRIFRYPLSYLIYSDGFDGLPSYGKDYVYRRLGEVLTGKDTSPEFSNLTAADRKALLEILTATKPEFAKAVVGRT